MFRNTFVALSLAIATVGITGCTSVPRFHEARKANVIIEYNSWDYTYFNKPAVMDGAFRKEVSTNEMDRVLSQYQVPRDLAVVQLGWMFTPDTMRETLDHWTQVMDQLHFKRVVYVANNGRKSVNGSRIIRDTQSLDNPPIESITCTKPSMKENPYRTVMTPMVSLFGE